MKIRAWANDDPLSNTTTTFIIPAGSYGAMPQYVLNREFLYNKARKPHVKQVSGEAMAWAQVCKHYNLLNDVFRLVRNKYIFRPVEKDVTVKAKQENQLQISTGMYVVALTSLICVVFMLLIAINVLSLPANVPRNDYAWDCSRIENGVPTCMPILDGKWGPTGLPGVPGPPGICSMSLLDGPVGPEGAKETRKDFTIIEGSGIKLSADSIKIKIQERD